MVLNSSEVRNLFEEFERKSSVIFVLDRRLQIVYCNEAWDRFAEANGGARLKRPNLYGICVLDAVPEFLKDLYRSAYSSVFTDLPLWEFYYECSTARIYRLFRMTVGRMPADDFIVVTNSLIEECPHGPERRVMPPDPARYGGFGDPVAMCFLCRRTRRRDGWGWDWVPAFVESPPRVLAASICDDCARKLGSHHNNCSGKDPVILERRV